MNRTNPVAAGPLRVISGALVIAVFLALLVGPAPTEAQGGISFFVTNVDASDFPDIQFDLRAVDLNNQVVANLTSAGVSVYENGQIVPEIELVPRSDAPVTIMYVVDQGVNAYYNTFGLNNLRLAMTTLVAGGFFVDGTDTVLVLGRQHIDSDQTVTLMPPTHQGSDLTTWAANFNFQRSSDATKGLLGVDDAIGAMSELVPVPGSQTAAIILITRYIEDPTWQVAITAAQNVAVTAKQKYISIYVFQTDAAKYRSESLQALALGATGQYVPLDRNTVSTVVGTVYQNLNTQRAAYTVRYRSVLGTSDPRQITINSPTAPTTGVGGSYQVSILPPQLTITSPAADSTIQRTAARASDGSVTYDPGEMTVTADIAWPENANPRATQLAELYLDGELQTTSQLEATDSQVQLVWDLSPLTEPGQRTASLMLKITDELSVESEAETTVNLDIAKPPSEAARKVLYGLGGIGILLLCCGVPLLLVVVGVIVYKRRPAQTAERARKILSDVQNTVIVGGSKGKGIGSLKVLEGPPGMIGETLELTRQVTMIGRNSEAAHIVFYPDEDSTISRVHCTIREAGKHVVLVDNNSTNGTMINGQAVKPNEMVQLREGDEIVLGNLASRGVKLKFSSSAEKPGGSAPEGLDRTYILDEWDKDSPVEPTDKP
jgi:hypothetical protein